MTAYGMVNAQSLLVFWHDGYRRFIRGFATSNTIPILLNSCVVSFFMIRYDLIVYLDIFTFTITFTEVTKVCNVISF